ncbi:MAG: hypothetical protein QOH12_766 [Solirubrobacteraceae bacterium]|nr:hypothetical protein [Solirubrobacteraceae bacterium]
MPAARRALCTRPARPETNGAGMIAASLIDTTALGKIILASLIGGVGVVVAFGLILLGLSKGSRAKGDGRTGAQAGYYLITGLCGLFCVAAVAFGIYAMVHKPSTPAPKPARASSAAVLGADVRI